MPDRGKAQGTTVLGNVLARLDRAERELVRLRGGQRATFDRGDTAAVPAPVEGQALIDLDSNVLSYYAGGAWRTPGGGGIQYGSLAGYNTFTDGVPAGFDFDDGAIVTNDGSIFSKVLDSTGSGDWDGLHGLGIATTGIYQVTYDVFLYPDSASVTDPWEKSVSFGPGGADYPTADYIYGESYIGGYQAIGQNSGGGVFSAHWTQLMEITAGTGISPLNISVQFSGVSVTLGGNASITALKVA